MFRILFRLYLVTIVSYSAAIYLVPDLVVMAFRDRFVTYNLEFSRGLQSLITKAWWDLLAAFPYVTAGTALWVAIALPVLFTLMAYGYSDQAPAALARPAIPA